MFTTWWRGRQARATARRMAAARRRGDGLYLQDWNLQPTALDGGPAAVTAVLGWCREVIAHCRRPWGIDHFDLAIACRSAAEGPVRSRRFLRLRPKDLYEEDIRHQLTALLHPAGEAPAASPLRVAAAVFSWGDAADRALPARP